MDGGFGQFYAYAATKIPYAIDCFTMEVKRQLDMLEQHLAKNTYLAGDEYSIADIAVPPWYTGVLKGWIYDAAQFLSAPDYAHMLPWADKILARLSVRRGRMVNRLSGPRSEQLRERHSTEDFQPRTQDKLKGQAG